MTDLVGFMVADSRGWLLAPAGVNRASAPVELPPRRWRALLANATDEPPRVVLQSPTSAGSAKTSPHRLLKDAADAPPDVMASGSPPLGFFMYA
ncbi:hypothetical protein [Nannocystis pusilla]|uniref:hypothetical protein n=1 Tax=Nannocystis pusilla TaxID=889268 RepID=UPI003DA428BD